MFGVGGTILWSDGDEGARDVGEASEDSVVGCVFEGRSFSASSSRPPSRRACISSSFSPLLSRNVFFSLYGAFDIASSRRKSLACFRRTSRSGFLLV